MSWDPGHFDIFRNFVGWIPLWAQLKISKSLAVATLKANKTWLTFYMMYINEKVCAGAGEEEASTARVRCAWAWHPEVCHLMCMARFIRPVCSECWYMIVKPGQWRRRICSAWKEWNVRWSDGCVGWVSRREYQVRWPNLDLVPAHRTTQLCHIDRSSAACSVSSQIICRCTFDRQLSLISSSFSWFLYFSVHQMVSIGGIDLEFCCDPDDVDTPAIIVCVGTISIFSIPVLRCTSLFVILSFQMIPNIFIWHKSWNGQLGVTNIVRCGRDGLDISNEKAVTIAVAVVSRLQDQRTGAGAKRHGVCQTGPAVFAPQGRVGTVQDWVEGLNWGDRLTHANSPNMKDKWTLNWWWWSPLNYFGSPRQPNI